MTQSHQSAENLISHLDANNLTAGTTTSAPAATQAAMPISSALGKAKRKLRSRDPEYSHQGKKPCYMCFIFGKNEIGCTPSATYTESSPPVPSVPASDYQHHDVMMLLDVMIHVAIGHSQLFPCYFRGMEQSRASVVTSALTTH